MTLVIHFNAFTGKLEGGYMMLNGKKHGQSLLPRDVLALLLANPDLRCQPLKV